MKYLITGGCGFIGSHAVDFLIDLGHDVVVIDNLSGDTKHYNDKAKYYEYNINDYTMCSDVFKKHSPDYVLHFAAEAKIQSCINDPLKAFETNSAGTLTMLELSKKYHIKKMVLSSTSAIYGNRNEQIETQEPDCLNPYALSKLQAEQYCKLYGILYNQQSICLRYFNVYGPRNPIFGQYAPVIGIFTKQKQNNENLTIVGDGEQTRDFIHVQDIIKANYYACNSDKQFYGDVFNVGTGVAYTINQIASKIEFNKNKHKYLPPRVGECRNSKANINKIISCFAWKPSIDLMSYLDNNK